MGRKPFPIRLSDAERSQVARAGGQAGTYVREVVCTVAAMELGEPLTPEQMRTLERLRAVVAREPMVRAEPTGAEPELPPEDLQDVVSGDPRQGALPL